MRPNILGVMSAAIQFYFVGDSPTGGELFRMSTVGFETFPVEHVGSYLHLKGSLATFNFVPGKFDHGYHNSTNGVGTLTVKTEYGFNNFNISFLTFLVNTDHSVDVWMRTTVIG